MALTDVPAVARARRPQGSRAVLGWLKVAAFLLPAFILLGALLLYPIIFTFIRSTFNASGDTFIGLANYQKIFTEPRTLIALRNNIIWVLVAPAVVTAVGLVLAVLSNKIAWRSVFRMFIFLPLVVSGLAAGVTFRFIYAADAQTGLANAVLQQVVHTFNPPGPYPTARASQPELLGKDDGVFIWADTVTPGSSVAVGLLGIPPARLPENAAAALPPQAAAADAIQGTVWLDFSPGGTSGVVDEGERGLPGVQVELLSDGRPVATQETDEHGQFAFTGTGAGNYTLRLAEASFRPPFNGVAWLGTLLITPAIMIGYIWIQTGFALIIIGAGLSGLDTELLDAGRVEGATEWQVFRYLTIPLLAPVLLVVMVTTVISVLKIFDLVLVIAPESVQYNANVLALEMWRASFGGARDFGVGSAVAVLLFLLIIPAMIFNLRRFRMEQ